MTKPHTPLLSETSHALDVEYMDVSPRQLRCRDAVQTEHLQLGGGGQFTVVLVADPGTGEGVL